MTALPGTGGPTFFRVLNVTGWQAKWTPDESGIAYVVAKAAVNPALVLDLPPWEGEGEDAALAKATAAFGKARSGGKRARWALRIPSACARTRARAASARGGGGAWRAVSVTARAALLAGAGMRSRTHAPRAPRAPVALRFLLTRTRKNARSSGRGSAPP
jgi:hypothetical protein